jgi:hypothetical protein
VREVDDYSVGRYSKRGKILYALVASGNITMKEYPATDATVTSVIEDLKISPGRGLECPGAATVHIVPLQACGRHADPCVYAV